MQPTITPIQRSGEWKTGVVQGNRLKLFFIGFLPNMVKLSMSVRRGMNPSARFLAEFIRLDSFFLAMGFIPLRQKHNLKF